LINTTLIYYPVFSFDLFLKSKESARQIEVVYDPFQDVLLKGVNCESCKREVREIFLCSSSHISCSSCHEKCSVCDSELCLNCSKKRCEFCGKKLCKKCGVKCASCFKNVCKNHSNKNYADDKIYCLNCLVRCDICSSYTNKARIKKVNEKNICEKCFRTSKLSN
jgi:hypothetical protein